LFRVYRSPNHRLGYGFIGAFKNLDVANNAVEALDDVEGKFCHHIMTRIKAEGNMLHKKVLAYAKGFDWAKKHMEKKNG
jgi:hypothetical protein